MTRNRAPSGMEDTSAYTLTSLLANGDTRANKTNHLLGLERTGKRCTRENQKILATVSMKSSSMSYKSTQNNRPIQYDLEGNDVSK